MDEVQISALIFGALAIGAAIGTWVLARYPGSRAWVREKAIEGYNYLDAVKDEVPPELKPMWQSAYDELDAIIDAFGDEQITMTELRHMAYHALQLIGEIRAIIKG